MIGLLAMAAVGAKTPSPALTCRRSYDHFKEEVGWGRGATVGEAVEQAEEKARAKAKRSLCFLFDSRAECDRRLAQAVTSAEQEKKAKVRGGWEACVGLSLDWDKIPELDAFMAQFNASLDRLGTDLAAELADTPVTLDVQMQGGCPVGASGRFVRQRIGHHVVEAASPAGAPRVALSLEVVPHASATLTCRVWESGKGGRPVGDPVTLPVGLVTETEAMASDCVRDADLKLADTAATSKGRSLGLTLDPGHSSFCSGEEATATVHVTRTSKVRLLSVAADGRSLQVWPYDGKGGVIHPGKPLSLPLTMLATDDGVERLVAVAVPRRTSLGALDGRVACRLPEPFRADALPEGSVVNGQLRYRVTKDARACAGVTPPSQLQAALATLPPCQP